MYACLMLPDHVSADAIIVTADQYMAMAPALGACD
jgi:hypothetical protein